LAGAIEALVQSLVFVADAAIAIANWFGSGPDVLKAIFGGCTCVVGILVVIGAFALSALLGAKRRYLQRA
jgi:hypothetical protein